MAPIAKVSKSIGNGFYAHLIDQKFYVLITTWHIPPHFTPQGVQTAAG